MQSLEPLPSRSGEQRFRIVLVVDNMDTEPVKIRESSSSCGSPTRGSSTATRRRYVIEALDQQTLTIEVGSEIVSSLSRLLSFVQGPENTLPYEIYGKVTLERKMIDPLSFSAVGEVPLVMTSER